MNLLIDGIITQLEELACISTLLLHVASTNSFLRRLDFRREIGLPQKSGPFLRCAI